MRRARMRLGWSHGQTSIEQVVLLIVVASALVAMFTYMTSAFSYRVKSSADGIGHGALYR